MLIIFFSKKKIGSAFETIGVLVANGVAIANGEWRGAGRRAHMWLVLSVLLVISSIALSVAGVLLDTENVVSHH